MLKQLAIHKINKTILNNQFQKAAKAARECDNGHFKRATYLSTELPYWGGRLQDGTPFVMGMTIDELPNHDFTFKGKPARLITEERAILFKK